MDIGYEEKLMEQVKEEDNDDVRYKLTEHFILYLVLEEYGIAVGEWH